MNGRIRSRMRQADISRLLGVSQSTVSLALSGSERISPELSARIRELAEETGYLPAPAGPGGPQLITLLVNENLTESFLPLDLLRGIETGLRKTDWKLQLLEMPNSIRDSQEELLQFLRRFAGRAILFGHSHEIPEAVVDLVERQGIAHMWINTRMPSDCVLPDDRGAARFAVTRLYRLGHRRIGYLRLRHCTHFSGEERCGGYRDAMRELTGSVDEGLNFSAEIEVDRRLAATMEWLRSFDEPPSAVLCYGGLEAIVAYTAALRLGLRIPEQFSIVAIHERLLIEQGVETTTLQVPFFELGRRAVEHLIRKLEFPGSTPLPPETIPMIFHPGGTMAPPFEHSSSSEENNKLQEGL